MTISINNRTFVGIAYLTLERLSDGVILTWPAPQNFVLNPGIEQVEQMGRDALGREVRTNTYVRAVKPELTVSYQYLQPEMIGYMVGEELISGTFDTSYPKLLTVTSATFAADTTGGILNGISADIDAKASVIREGSISTLLTRQPFATFTGTSPANDDSFAIGANGALKFSDNLVTNSDVVALLIPVSVTGTKISDVLVGEHRVYATLVDTQNQVVLFEAYNVEPNLNGRTINFGESSSEFSFYVNNPPGGCRAWNLVDTGKSVACVGE